MGKRREERTRPNHIGDPRMQKKCWCGAAKYASCVDHEGNPTPVHNTRGLQKKVVVAMAKAAGIPWPR